MRNARSKSSNSLPPPPQCLWVVRRLMPQIRNSKFEIRTPPSPRAFTFVEVLIVVAIVGIAGALVVPQMLSAGTLGIQAAARMVVADILYAQNDAIAQQANRRVIFDPLGDSYRLADSDGTTLDIHWRSGGGSAGYSVNFAKDNRFQGVELVSAKFGDDATLEFDALGTPMDGGTVELRFNGTRYEVKVAAFTGRVTVTKLAG